MSGTPHHDDPMALNRRFAAVQQWGTRIALTAVLASFALYAAGLLAPLVPLRRLPGLLYEGAALFRSAQDLPAGWAWLRQLQHGDALTLGALVGMMTVVMFAYASLVPLLVRRRDWLYLALVVLQLFVFAIAAHLIPGLGG